MFREILLLRFFSGLPFGLHTAPPLPDVKKKSLSFVTQC